MASRKTQPGKNFKSNLLEHMPLGSLSIPLYVGQIYTTQEQGWTGYSGYTLTLNRKKWLLNMNE